MNNSLVSVIVPVYNVQDYIEKCLDSVIGQNYSNLEIIVVDDGSTDNTSKILERYAKKDTRINVIYQKNSGVSEARNNGLKRATGEYIHFLDGDDQLSRNFYTESVKMLKDNVNIDIVASKIKFFDGIIDSHPLNNKFYKKRIINLNVEPDNPLLHITSCLFRAESLANKTFDSRLKVSEDVTLISEVLLNKKSYGVITKSTYYYRKRNNDSSAIGGKFKNKSYYFDTPKYAYEHMFAIWNESGLSTPIQYTFLYDLSHILQQKSQSILSKQEEKQYKEVINGLIKKCGDKSIADNSYLTVHQKLYVWRCKYGQKLENHIKIKSTKLYFDEYAFYDYVNTTAYIDFIEEIRPGQYEIEGYIDAPLSINDVNLHINSGETTRTTRYQLEQSFLGDVYFDGGAFISNINVNPKSNISFILNLGGIKHTLNIRTNPFTRLASSGFAYRVDESKFISKTNKYTINFKDKSIVRHTVYEIRLLLRILSNWKFYEFYRRFIAMKSRNFKQLTLKAKLFEFAKPFLFPLETIAMIPRAFILRFMYYFLLANKKKQIWLVSDRSMMGRDNGEAMFKYVSKMEECPADVYFVISKKSKDYNRIGKIGRVVNQEGLYYKALFLISDKIIASQAEIETTNPFFRTIDHYVDLYNFDFIFLQHGIIRHDLSAWLNKYNNNISLFITSTQKEYDSILSLPYYYSEDKLLLSGLARYDYLDNDPQGVLMLAPTYRKSLVLQKSDTLGRRGYDNEFKHTKYREFYNSFINDKRIINALSKADMKGEFYLHPVFSEQHPDFDSNDTFSVKRFPYEYSDALRRANAIVSDYSSIVFDMAYMKKPVIYAQYDRDTFFEGQTYDKSDLFSDENDGFGEVYYDYESLIGGVVKMINDKCRMKEVYKKRVDNFFFNIDKENSKRTYEAILNMDK